jgi:4-amino-4-deoxy-L-arabinose transferase-like glycosyltransferase
MTPRFFGLSPAAAAAALLAVLTALRFGLAVWLPLVPDEAYYWQWSRHLDASYFSKGPAVAYTIRAGTALFGDTSLGIRFFAVLLSAGTAWQVFLLARRWYDEVTGLVAVLLLTVVPIYEVGAVLMTIDPLSAFFWVWAANLFSSSLERDRWRDWTGAGFALGCGFLSKYLNAVELVAFALFLLAVPRRRATFGRPGFWWMLAVAFGCTVPVWWWNARHHWASAVQLAHRGGLNGRFTIHLSTLLHFVGAQGLVISPLLFLALLGAAAGVVRRGAKASEGDILLVLLFLLVFLPYASLALHLRGEPNWPAISYLGLIVVLASRWKAALSRPAWFLIAAYLVAWTESLLLYYLRVLPVPPHLNPTSRLLGWQEIATHLDQERREQRADALIADGYKGASILSFYLPDHVSYTRRTRKSETEYDFWPGYPTGPGHRALWITDNSTPVAVAPNFNSIDLLENIEILDRGHVLRRYSIYRCENR